MARASHLPSGTVTFLLTDLESSTPLWERYPEAMEVALVRHDRILRSVIEAHEGYVFSLAGDAFAAAFSTARAAADAARAIAVALRATAWPDPVELRVRIGMHTGAAEERDGNYFGTAVNRAARVMAAAHGGQILTSNATAALLEGAPLLDLGRHRLRGLAGVEHLWQLGPAAFPPLRTTPAASDSLPVIVSSFLGREAEIRQVVDLVDQRRLVTLVGAGGIGKSRLAICAARAMGSRFPDGLWWCDLQVATDTEGFGHAVLRGLGAVPLPGMAPVDGALTFMAERRMLVVLDNCEHLLGDSAGLAERIGAEHPGVHLLCTSREPLDAPGEQVVAIGGLDAATDLFVDRARELDAGFELLDGEAGALEELCARLDAMPLAIELAAARCRSMRPAELLARIDDRFRLLRGKRRAERHQTLGATVRWSFDLLSPIEQRVFVRLSVFPGSFDMAAATWVCRTESVDEAEVEDALGALVDRSLVVTMAGGPSTRFRLLETMRAWGAEWLRDHDDVEELRARHSAYYGAIARRGGDLFWSTDEPEAWRVLGLEWVNIRAAMTDALERGDAVAADVLGRLGLWGVYAYRPEIGRWSRDAVVRGLVDPAGEWVLRGAWGAWAYWHEAEYAEVDRATGRQVDDGLFAADGTAALAAFQAAQARGQVAWRDALIARWLDAAPYPGVSAAFAHYAALIASSQDGDPEAAEAHAAAIAGCLDQVGSVSVRMFLHMVSASARIPTDPAAALAGLAASERMLDHLPPDHMLRIPPHVYLCIAALRLERWELAADHAHAVLVENVRWRFRQGLIMGLILGAALLLRRGYPEDAAAMLGTAEATGYRGGITFGLAEETHDALMAALGERASRAFQRDADVSLLDAAHRALGDSRLFPEADGAR
jgi:predicted ATPase/class 3 adenylate cyclase